MFAGENFKDHIAAFEKKLELVDVNEISDQIYCRKYLSHLFLHKKYYLAIYADVLQKLLKHSAQQKNDISLIDYGAGNGLLGIFAKFCGFKKVFVNDIDEKFVRASEKLAACLGISIDGFIPGEVNAVNIYFKNEKPQAIIGTDVIEHIYDLEVFFTTIQRINPSMVSVFTTASNPENIFKVRSLQKLQMKDELEGGTPDDHILFGAVAHEPYLNIRKEIIRKLTEGLSEPEIIQLAKATRGKNEADIGIAVDEYKVSGKLPIPASGTNTCNPLTGSWTERILSLDEYISIYNAAGFTCKFYAGFYDTHGKGTVPFVKKLLNAAITTMGKKISPYIVIVGRKK